MHSCFRCGGDVRRCVRRCNVPSSRSISVHVLWSVELRMLQVKVAERSRGLQSAFDIARIWMLAPDNVFFARMLKGQPLLLSHDLGIMVLTQCRGLQCRTTGSTAGRTSQHDTHVSRIGNVNLSATDVHKQSARSDSSHLTKPDAKRFTHFGQQFSIGTLEASNKTFEHSPRRLVTDIVRDVSRAALVSNLLVRIADQMVLYEFCRLPSTMSIKHSNVCVTVRTHKGVVAIL